MINVICEQPFLGYTAVKAAAAVHIIKCTPITASVDFDRKGCWNEIPLLLQDAKGKYLNQSYWAHPISKVLLPTETVVPCNKALAQVYHLEAADHYYCSFGHGLSKCPEPLILTPSSANLHDQLVNDIAVPMGAGVMTQEKSRQMQFRVFFHQYSHHLQNELLAQNERDGRIKAGLPITVIPDKSIIDGIQMSIGSSIAPFYPYLKDAYAYIIGIIMICTVTGAAVGLLTRIYVEIKVNGITHRLFLAFFQGIYHVATVPIEFLKSGYRGTVRYEKDGVEQTLAPLHTLILELKGKIETLEKNQIVNNSSRGNYPGGPGFGGQGFGHTFPSPPPPFTPHQGPRGQTPLLPPAFYNNLGPQDRGNPSQDDDAVSLMAQSIGGDLAAGTVHSPDTVPLHSIQPSLPGFPIGQVSQAVTAQVATPPPQATAPPGNATAPAYPDIQHAASQGSDLDTYPSLTFATAHEQPPLPPVTNHYELRSLSSSYSPMTRASLAATLATTTMMVPSAAATATSSRPPSLAGPGAVLSPMATNDDAEARFQDAAAYLNQQQMTAPRSPSRPKNAFTATVAKLSDVLRK